MEKCTVCQYKTEEIYNQRDKLIGWSCQRCGHVRPIVDEHARDNAILDREFPVSQQEDIIERLFAVVYRLATECKCSCVRIARAALEEIDDRTSE